MKVQKKVIVVTAGGGGSKVLIEKLLNDILARYGYVDDIISNAGIIQPFIKVNELG